jgi:phosphoglycolate phosphatase-like HAD superfamily hydrolase
MLRLILDFDGPIMDISQRYYKVYLMCLDRVKLPEQELNIFSLEEFWNLKRDCIAEEKIADKSGLNKTQREFFVQFRNKLAHKLEFLQEDSLIEGVIPLLETLKNMDDLDLLVMTMRKKKELELALKQHNLEKFFPTDRRYYIEDNYIKKSDIKDKPLLMAKALKELPPVENTWMIGDKEADIVSARNHNIKIVAVLSGIRNRYQLERYKPDFIADNLVQAVEIILKQRLH